MREMNLDYISIGAHRYALEKLNPMDAITWGNRVLAVVGPTLGGLVDACSDKGNFAKSFQGIFASYNSTEASNLMLEALRQCYTPQNESLADDAVFNKWFKEHPGDLYHLGVMAVYELVKDFFPNQLVTIANASLAKMTFKADEQ